jgi:hypothetical protein
VPHPTRLAIAAALALAASSALDSPQAKPTGSPAAAPAPQTRNAADLSRITRPIVGCASVESLKKLFTALTDADTSRLAKLLRETTADGSCRLVEPGPASVEATSPAGAACVKPAGQSACLWIPKLMVAPPPARPDASGKHPDPNKTVDELHFLPTDRDDALVTEMLGRDTKHAVVSATRTAQMAAAACFESHRDDTDQAATCAVNAVRKGDSRKFFAFADCTVGEMTSDDGHRYAVGSSAKADGARTVKWLRADDRKPLAEPDDWKLALKLTAQFGLLCPYILDDAEVAAKKTGAGHR